MPQHLISDPRRVETEFRRHLRWAVIWPLAAFFFAAGALVALVLYVQAMSRWVDHADVVIGRATLVERLIVDRESQLRAYMVTGDRRFSDFYREADERLAPVLSNLQALVSDDPPQVARLVSMRGVLARWREYAEQQLGRSRDAATARDVPFHVLDGEASASDIRSRLHEFIEVEQALRVRRGIRADAVTRYAFWLGLVFSLLLGPALALTTAHQMRRSTRKYREALEALESTARSLRESEDSLRESDRRKDEFLGMLSHELRNPLAPITNCLYILKHAEPTGQQARRAKEVIGRQVGHLIRLVDDLLDVTRIARGKVQLRPKRLELGELVRRTGEDHRELLKDRGLEFAIDTPDRAVWVDGDETRLAQVIGNLLHNAAKFTPTGGKVTLSLVALERAAELHVIDTGAGIAPALLGRIFDPLVQAEQTLARSEGGLGLGLALVKSLVELHGGSVEARSGGPGKGAEFVIHLLTVPALEPGRVVDGSVRGPHRALRVLVVEDNVDAAESLAELVRLFGHEVEVAHDGPSAIAKATAAVPDLVLCDIGLPGMNGYQVAGAFRLDTKLRTTRLLAVSGYAQPEDVQRAVEAGFIGHIPKPLDPSVLEKYLVTT